MSKQGISSSVSVLPRRTPRPRIDAWSGKDGRLVVHAPPASAAAEGEENIPDLCPATSSAVNSLLMVDAPGLVTPVETQGGGEAMERRNDQAIMCA